MTASVTPRAAIAHSPHGSRQVRPSATQTDGYVSVAAAAAAVTVGITTIAAAAIGGLLNAAIGRSGRNRYRLTAAQYVLMLNQLRTSS